MMNRQEQKPELTETLQRLAAVMSSVGGLMIGCGCLVLLALFAFLLIASLAR